MLPSFSSRPFQIIRACTDRANLQYVEEDVEDMISDHLPFLQNGEKIIVYTNTKRNAEELSVTYTCRYYHGELELQEAEDILEDFMNNLKTKMIIATSALNAGIHCPAVRGIYFQRRRFDIINFVQSAGRGGRDGNPATITICVAGEKLFEAAENRQEMVEMSKIVRTKGCRP